MPLPKQPSSSTLSESEQTGLRSRFMECRAAFGAIALTSGGVNILYLTSSIFMMQVYDRVLGSQSVQTLIALSLFAIAAYLFQGFLDLLRQRMLSRIAEHVDWRTGPDLCGGLVDMTMRSACAAARETLQPFRDLDAVRGFATGGGMLAVLDMPWIPIYFGLLFLLHPLLGWLCVAGSIVMLLLASLTELTTREPTKAAAEAMSVRNHLAEMAQRGSEVIYAMGMKLAIVARWTAAHKRYLALQRRAADRGGMLAVLSKTFRYILQSAVLGLGAYLAIQGEISAGSIIAASILSSRALAPIDLAIGNWKGFLIARQAWSRLTLILAAATQAPSRMALPSPARELIAEHLYVGAPGSTAPIISNIQLKISAGSALGVIGPSASGKSTLARALIGVWPLLRGRVLLDGASVSQWERDVLGKHVGYLPQDVQVFEGTIGENIARFQADSQPDAIIKAAEEAGFHRHVVDLPDGYNTRVGIGGSHLSSGQRQRLGLARALYASPFLVVLDEPNANLDAEGEAAVAHAITSVRQRGGIAIVVAHRPSAIQAVDLLLVMRNGAAVAFGPRDDVLAKTVQNSTAPAAQRDHSNVTEFEPRHHWRAEVTPKS